MSNVFGAISLRISAHVGAGRAATAFLVALLVFAGSIPAPGAGVNPFGKAGGSLTAEDWAQLNAARAKVLAEPAAVGMKEAWTNPKSGNSGTIAITGPLKHGGMECRSVRYVFHLKSQKSPGTYQMKECKASDGNWKYL